MLAGGLSYNLRGVRDTALWQVTTGGVVSKILTVKLQEAVLPPPSVAVAVTVVMPSGKLEPGA